MHTASKRWGEAMKKCPHCKADIEENARFCLYCMTPLDEKQTVNPAQHNHTTRWLVLLAAFLVLALAAGGIWLGLGQGLPVSTKDGGSSSSRTTTGEASSETDNASSAGESAPADTSQPGHTAPAGSSPPAGQTDPSSGGTQPRPQPSPGTASGGVSADTTSGSPSVTTTASATGTTGTQAPGSSAANPPASTTTPPASSVVYTYRQAQKGDDYWRRSFDEDEVVITGVRTASETGEYVIPEQIDGKTVIAVMHRAFTDEDICDTVRKVVVPATVTTIWDYAFSTCYNLTDIYFCGDAIYTSPQAFAWEPRRTGTLTIHCSADCSDRNFRYYKDCADGSYDAVYEEWNG